MTESSSVFAPQSAPYRVLQGIAREARCAVICGIPGTGKSLMLREQVLIAREHGRIVHRLQWDVARQSFEQPEILARYPEVGGSTHPVIRRGVGLWVRGAIADWFHEHPDAQKLLVIEAPLVGGRLIELARIEADSTEALLTAPTTCFLVPQPSRAVRAAIEAARVRESAEHRHARDAANAPPALVDAVWQLVLDVADALEVRRDPRDVAYSPELYYAVYSRLLRHRRVSAVPVSQVVAVSGSPHALGSETSELMPSPEQAAQLIGTVESVGSKG